MDYVVTVNFGGFIGADVEYEVSADSEEEAEEASLEAAAEDLTVDDIVDEGDGNWTVTVGFAGMVGVGNDYDVTGDDEDEASEAAIEEAKWDLEVDSVEEA